MSDTILLTSLRGQTLWVTLNRPERLNALNNELLDELYNLFVGLGGRGEVRTVVLRGAGPNFCAGIDLKNSASSEGRMAVEETLQQQQRVSRIAVAMRRCPQPIICLVDGAAAGGGFALALASDVRIATPSARMNAAFIKIGLSACDFGVSYFLPRMVGASVASEFMLTGRFLHADRAAALGLVSKVVAAEELDVEAEALIADMHRATPLGLRLTKDALNFSIDAGGLEAVIAMEDRNQVMASASDDVREGVRAFLEKREPSYGSR